MSNSQSDELPSAVDEGDGSADVEDPIVQYVYDSMGRIDVDIGRLASEMQRVATEVRGIRDDLRRQEKDRILFQSAMIGVSNKIRKRVDELWSHVRRRNTGEDGTQYSGAFGSKKLCKLEVRSEKVAAGNNNTTNVKTGMEGRYENTILVPNSSQHNSGQSDAAWSDVSGVKVVGFTLDKVNADTSSLKVEEETQRNGIYIRHKVGENIACDSISRVGVRSEGAIVKPGPYLLRKAFPAVEHGKLIDYIFDDELDSREVIVDTEESFLTRGLLCCLKPSCFVSGEVINVIAEFLTRFERKRTTGKAETWYLPTRMTPDSMLPEKDATAYITKYRIKETFMGSLVYCRKIFIPVHRENHWLLLCVLVKEEVVQIWDSWLYCGRSTGRNDVPNVMKVLDDVLAVDIKGSKHRGWAFSNFGVETMQSSPQQPNNFDCGVFVINFMENRKHEYLMADKFQSQDERARIVLKTVLSEYNNVYKDVLMRACKHGSLSTKKNDPATPA